MSCISDPDDHQHKPVSNGEDEAFLLAMQLSTASVVPMAMKAAIDLDLLSIMAKANPSQLSPSEIASQIPTQNPEAPLIIDRILYLLASHSILTCTLDSTHNNRGRGRPPQRLYGLAPASKYFVPNEDGVSLDSMLLIFQDKVTIDSWYHLKDAVLEGGMPFMKAHGMQGFEYAAKDARMQNLFNKSMHNHTCIVMKRVLETYKGFEGLNDVVDVGGGLGANLMLVVSKYPQIRGINFDLPYVIQDAPSYPGVEHIGGDMFVQVPKGQAIFMKWILHDWGDDQCLKLLKNCYDALPEFGKVIVVESIVSEFPDTDIVTQNISRLDLSVFNTIPGAKERTMKEFEALAREAGFSDTKIISRAYFYWVIEFNKNNISTI